MKVEWKVHPVDVYRLLERVQVCDWTFTFDVMRALFCVVWSPDNRLFVYSTSDVRCTIFFPGNAACGSPVIWHLLSRFRVTSRRSGTPPRITYLQLHRQKARKAVLALRWAEYLKLWTENVHYYDTLWRHQARIRFCPWRLIERETWGRSHLFSLTRRMDWYATWRT